MARMAALLTLFSLVGFVHAHGYPTAIRFHETTVSTWLPFVDPYLSPVPNKLTRKFNSDGPVTDITSKAITCNTNGATMDVPVSTVQHNVEAGFPVTFFWTTWPEDHKGPVITYMADCQGDCTKFDGSTGNVWFKIDEAGYSNGVWASDKLRANSNSWTVTIPKALAAGQYLIRHEILALHGAFHPKGAQFYPSCNQIAVTSSGTLRPAGVALPGAYKFTDPGIFVDIWADGFHNYIIPGPPVISASSKTTYPGNGSTKGSKPPGKNGQHKSPGKKGLHKPTPTHCAPTKTVTVVVTKTVCPRKGYGKGHGKGRTNITVLGHKHHHGKQHDMHRSQGSKSHEHDHDAESC